MKDYLVKYGDTFGVERRIKEIDSTYEIFFNLKTKKYEVYSKGSLAVVCPYSELDYRLIPYIRKTRVERSRDIFEEIEEHNQKVAKKLKETSEEKAKYSAIERLNKLKSKL